MNFFFFFINLGIRENRGSGKLNKRIWQKSQSFVYHAEGKTTQISNNIVRSTTFPSEDVKNDWDKNSPKRISQRWVKYKKLERKLPERPKTGKYSNKNPCINKMNKNWLVDRQAEESTFGGESIYKNNREQYATDVPIKVEYSKNVSKSFSSESHFLKRRPIEKKNVDRRSFSGRLFPEEVLTDEENWFSRQTEEAIALEELKALRFKNRFQSFISPEFDKISNSSSSTDFWFETNSDYELEKNLCEPFDVIDESDDERFYVKSRKFFEKSTETFLNNSLTNLKNNNLPFADIKNKNLFPEKYNYNFYDKMEDHFNFYQDNFRLDYSYYFNNNSINNNGKLDNLNITKLSIPSSKRPLGVANVKTNVKQLNNNNNRNYFFTNRLFNENLYLNSYNNRNFFYNFWFHKGKNNNNKNYQATSLARPLCFSANR